MSLKAFSGRKRDSPIWSYFVYDAISDRSTCQVTGSDGKQCERTLVGKNSTNLITHLRTAHKNAYAEFSSRNDDMKSSKVDAAIASRTSGLSGTTARITCFMKAPKTWPRDSDEAVVHDRALCTMVVMTGAPLKMVVNPAFKSFCQKFWPVDWKEEYF
jgi:hypothetical protein